MKNILVLTASLSSGGITSFTIPLVNELSKKHNVTLLYTVDECERIKQISENVKLVTYKTPKTIDVLLQMARKGWLLHILKIKFRNHKKVAPMPSNQRISYASAEITGIINGGGYDLGISTAEFYCNDLLVNKINAKRKIGWIHPDYKALKTDVKFDRLVLDKLDLIVTVSKKTKESLIEVIPDYKEKVVYIPNLLDQDKISRLSEVFPKEYEDYKNKKRIVTVCRIDNSSKRLDRIISIVKELITKEKNFHWFIVGEGSDHKMIQNLIDENNLNSYISMLGLRNNPYPYIKHANLFVLTSQYEGKPVVIDEAIALNCPIITTEYASAKEQVTKQYGYVINNNDTTVATEFTNILNWSQLQQIKANMDSIGYCSKNYEEFESNLNEIIN